MNRTIREAVVAGIVLVGVLLTGPSVLAQGYATNVIDGIAVDDSAVDYVVGTNDTYNALAILHGRSLTNVNGIIGFQMGADFNAAYVSNAGSAWINSSVLYVGNGGVSNSSGQKTRPR